MIFSRIGIFFKVLVISTAASLIAYALFPGSSLDLLLKLLAVSFGASMLSPFAYPHVRGVRAGDNVLVFSENESVPLVGFSLKSGVALDSGRVGGVIKVGFADGSEISCKLTNYAGLFTPARARVSPKAFEVEVR